MPACMCVAGDPCAEPCLVCALPSPLSSPSPGPTGSKAEQPCGPGYYQDLTGATSCKTTTAGYYTVGAVNNGSSLILCPAGSYCQRRRCRQATAAGAVNGSHIGLSCQLTYR